MFSKILSNIAGKENETPFKDGASEKKYNINQPFHAAEHHNRAKPFHSLQNRQSLGKSSSKAN
jgi:hypothetical protein